MVLREIIGQVISNRMNKTVTVSVSNKVKHKKYNKIIYKTKKYYAHDENNQYKIGDIVKIQQTRPLSKYKCWKVVKTTN